MCWEGGGGGLVLVVEAAEVVDSMGLGVLSPTIVCIVYPRFYPSVLEDAGNSLLWVSQVCVRISTSIRDRLTLSDPALRPLHPPRVTIFL